MTTLTDAAFLAALHERLNKIDREIAPMQREREALQTLIGQVRQRCPDRASTWEATARVNAISRDDAICVSRDAAEAARNDAANAGYIRPGITTFEGPTRPF
jgi:protoporphyrinogen oxidase